MKYYLVSEEQLDKLEGLAEEHGAFVSVVMKGEFAPLTNPVGSYAAIRADCRKLDVPEALMEAFRLKRNTEANLLKAGFKKVISKNSNIPI